MEEIRNTMSRKKTLLMLSGGRDSFLSACKMIKAGYDIDLVTYDNGCISAIENVSTVVKRLSECFGKQRIHSYTIQPIAIEFNRLRNTVENKEIVDICKEYPYLLVAQTNCLACHTAMYLHAIAQCLVSGIDTITEGAREQQGFFVALPEMKERYETLCRKYGIELMLPVYDLQSDVERKNELGQFGFTPKSYEPQCWVGRPLISSLTQEQRESLAKYYDNEIEPLTHDIIKKLQEIKPYLNKEAQGYM